MGGDRTETEDEGALPRYALLVVRLSALVALAFSAALAVDYYTPGDTFCAAGGGCEAVRLSGVGRAIGVFLPALGILSFSMIFAGTLVVHRKTLRVTSALALGAAVGAVGLLALQGGLIGAYCYLCVGVDVSAVVGGVAALVVLLSPDFGEEYGSRQLTSPWWGAYWLALMPIAVAIAFPDPPVPAEIRELWDESADVNVVEMADFECPYCRALHPLLSEVVEQSGADVHIARVEVPLAFHRHARHLSAAHLCAADEERGEVMADVLFGLEDTSEESVLEAAAELGFEPEAFTECMGSEAIDARIEADIERARAAGMEGLPTVYIGHRRLLGFDARRGAAPYADAMAAAVAGEGRRRRLWPFGALLGLSLLSLVIGLRARRRERARAEAVRRRAARREEKS